MQLILIQVIFMQLKHELCLMTRILKIYFECDADWGMRSKNGVRDNGSETSDEESSNSPLCGELEDNLNNKMFYPSIGEKKSGRVRRWCWRGGRIRVK